LASSSSLSAARFLWVESLVVVVEVPRELVEALGIKETEAVQQMENRRPFGLGLAARRETPEAGDD
jgi:hypothetical protein